MKTKKKKAITHTILGKKGVGKTIHRNSSVNFKTAKLITKWLEDMVKHGFMSGWCGDKSDQFKREQYHAMKKVVNGDVKLIGGNYRLLATIHSDYLNLKQYCGWNDAELKELLALFGFTKIEEVGAVMASQDIYMWMENGKLKKGVRFYLTPTYG